MSVKIIGGVLGVLGGVVVYRLSKTIAPNLAPVAEKSASNILNMMQSNSILDTLLNKSPAEAASNNMVEMQFFSPSEFGGWFNQMSPELLKKLDQFRKEWGFPVQISPHQDAVGREDATSQSQHNVMRWGEVRAVDVFPKNSIGGYINSKAELKRAYDIARRVGFNGVGLYTDTAPGHMVHLDVRKGAFAKWSRIAGQYKSINEALV